MASPKSNGAGRHISAMTKRIHFLHRFWAVVNERDEVWPHTVRYHRHASIAAFQKVGNAAYGTWRQARAAGFRLERVKVQIV